MDPTIWIDKFGFPIAMAAWLTFYGWFMTRRYIAATDASAQEQKQSAERLADTNAKLAMLSSNSTSAIQQNTTETRQLSSVVKGLTDQIGRLTACEARAVAAQSKDK